MHPLTQSAAHASSPLLEFTPRRHRPDEPLRMRILRWWEEEDLVCPTLPTTALQILYYEFTLMHRGGER